VANQRDAAPRHHTLWATLDWSHALLPAAEQRLFARLAVFVGGWTLEACEQVVSGAGIESTEVLDLLTELVAKSLVVVETSPEGRVRYRFLEMVRQYARERLVSQPDYGRVRARHRDWFLASAESANRAVHGPTEAVELARLDPELDNLRAALEWSAIDTTELDHALTVAGGMWWFWQSRGYFREGREQIEHLLSKAGPGAAPAARTEALVGAGMLAWNQGGSDDLAAARELMS
jgi:predicted ATPase